MRLSISDYNISPFIHKANISVLFFINPTHIWKGVPEHLKTISHFLKIFTRLFIILVIPHKMVNILSNKAYDVCV